MTLDDCEQFGEVQYYFKLTLVPDSPAQAFAMVSVYSPPDKDLLAQSSHTLWSCCYRGEQRLQIIDVHSIQAVVAMIPHPTNLVGLLTASIVPAEITVGCQVFLVEKLGLDVLALTNQVDNVDRDDADGP